MPTKQFKISADTPPKATIEMVESIGKATGTVVVCQPVLEVEAAESVLKALDALMPKVNGRAVGRPRKYKKRSLPSEADLEPLEAA